MLDEQLTELIQDKVQKQVEEIRKEKVVSQRKALGQKQRDSAPLRKSSLITEMEF
jgi:hypothetical protein